MDSIFFLPSTDIWVHYFFIILQAIVQFYGGADNGESRKLPAVPLILIIGLAYESITQPLLQDVGLNKSSVELAVIIYAYSYYIQIPLT